MVRSLKVMVIVLLLMMSIVLTYVYFTLRQSLPLLEGSLHFNALNEIVMIERDKQGIPTIKSQKRSDTAFALGFLHAQERFFQMDLLRRNSAGELSELFGKQALAFDSKMRIHQFRKRAQLTVSNLPSKHKTLLDAYTQGVNAGIDHLPSAPFEYHILNTKPAKWQHADSALVLFSMYIDLQPQWSESERSLAVMNDILPADWFDFLTSQGGSWDAPLQGGALIENSIIPKQPLASFSKRPQTEKKVSHYQFFDQVHYGSNSWSVSGALTKHGGAMVADDMHLKLRVPNIWYRASWYLSDGRRMTGASLPGTPAMVVGSNEHIAWGFTNSQGDFHDVIVLKINDEKTHYLTESGFKAFTVETENILVKGQNPKTVAVKLTQWGPVIGKNQKGELLAMRWVAHDIDGVNFRLLDLETIDTVDDALQVAALSGVPGQNFNVVDKAGNQAWTIMGRIPKRFGFETGMGEHFNGSQFPQDWSQGDKGWNGYLEPAYYPTVVNPSEGRIWTANARVVSGERLKKVGINNYALGARQKQIRDGLYAMDSFDEQDFLNIQLDDKAVFLQRWHMKLSELVNANTTGKYKDVTYLLKNWEGRASRSSVGYLLVKRFRENVVDQTAGEIYRYLDNNSNEFWPSSIDNFVEYPVWQLISAKPEQHVPYGFHSWDQFLLAMLDKTTAALLKNGGKLADQTWGKANTLAIQHPLSRAMPVLSWLLDMPAVPMNGDTYMPRVQKSNSGASQRFTVAPSHEEDGYFHMATGQSSHPLSAYFDEGHQDWVEGKPSSFLPGDRQWTLTLQPN
ncbi:MAG: penicillin amidase [Oceanicoccus sp.]|jgi:penicillin amidase